MAAICALRPSRVAASNGQTPLSEAAPNSNHCIRVRTGPRLMLRLWRPGPDGVFLPMSTISPNAYRGHPATCGTRQEDFREHAGSDHIILPGGAFLSQSHPKSRPSRFFWSILDPHLSDRASKSLACKGRRAIHRPTMGET
jgi:hypothetical protein